jgi:hypothetical protein
MDYNREIIAPRVFAGFGLLLIVVLLFVALRAESAEGPRPPLEATVVTQCGKSLYILFILSDGTVEKVTPTADSLGAIVDLLKVTAHVRVLQMDCTAVGHDSVN